MEVNIDDYAEILLTTKCPCCGKKLGMKLYEKMQPGQTQRCFGPNNIKPTLVEEERMSTSDKIKLRNKKTGKIIKPYYVELRIWHDSETPEDIVINSLAELNEEWEDHKPAEPLIKDEKIKELLGEVVELELTVNELGKRFNEFNKHYAELCGEEEE